VNGSRSPRQWSNRLEIGAAPAPTRHTDAGNLTAEGGGKPNPTHLSGGGCTDAFGSGAAGLDEALR
jgi:hypothetical protein